MKSLKRINILKSTLDWHFGEFVFYSADVLFVEKGERESCEFSVAAIVAIQGMTRNHTMNDMGIYSFLTEKSVLYL